MLMYWDHVGNGNGKRNLTTKEKQKFWNIFV